MLKIVPFIGLKVMFLTPKAWENAPSGWAYFSKNSKSLFDGPEGCFDASADTKFFEDAVQMALDRLFADTKLIGNFFVRGAFHEDAQDFFLPGRQTLF